MEYRYESDSMGKIEVPINALWGAQTQRSLRNFRIGEERMPLDIIYALALIKKSCAISSSILNPTKMTEQKLNAIIISCDKILDKNLDEHFPLSVWQTGSGTQTNMNVNEVIANYANKEFNANLHPNDDVNMSQSTNDVFPTAIHVAGVINVEDKLIPSVLSLIEAFNALQEKYKGVIKVGRTHFQDATPILFSQEIDGWKGGIINALDMIKLALNFLKKLPIGGTAVGTGINAPQGFSQKVVDTLNELTNRNFVNNENKFQGLSMKDDVLFMHSALKTLAVNLQKIANDIRFLSCGPRAGIGEITIPSNEPGSSIMPGKVNPTQCEAVIMVSSQVIANDLSITMGASSGNCELNVNMPLIAYSFLQSIRLLTDVINSFTNNLVVGIEVNEKVIKKNLDNSLMLVTALSPVLGYEKSAYIAKYAFDNELSLKDACLELGFLTEEEYEKIVDYKKMV